MLFHPRTVSAIATRILCLSLWMPCASFASSPHQEAAQNLLSAPKNDEKLRDNDNFWKISNTDNDGYRKLIEKDGAIIDMRHSVTAAFLKVHRSQYGAGSYKPYALSTKIDHPGWEEYASSHELRVRQTLENTSEVYGRLGAVMAHTRSSGDASAVITTANNPFLIDFEEICVGWKSGDAYAIKDLVDVSVGDQSISIGDDFLIQSGTSDVGRRAAYYYGPRSTFSETALLKINGRPLRAKFFHLANKSNQRHARGFDQPRARMYGADLEYVMQDPKDASQELWNLGFTAARIYKSDTRIGSESTIGHRQGLELYHPRMGGYFLPFNRNVRFHAGYVLQHNSKMSRKTNAHAYYVEPGYHFRTAPWSPLLTYRYMSMSGDRSPGSSHKTSYDPLFFRYWARDGYGTWETGQIYGTFYFTNTNQRVHTVQLKMHPSSKHALGVQYFNVNFVRTGQSGSVSRRAADEWNGYVSWDPYKWISFSTVMGVSIPKNGVKEILRDAYPSLPEHATGKKTYFGYLAATLKF